MMNRINVGCGRDVKEGWLNCDLHPASDEVVEIDLNHLPLPFADDSFDEVLLSHVLEHMGNRYEVMMEMHRILRIGGVLHVKLPIHSNRVEHDSWYHQRDFFHTLLASTPGNYGQRNFALMSFEKRMYPCRQRLKDKWNRLVSWLESLVFFEYYWRLKKV